MCGERSAHSTTSAAAPGSSPRVRGTLAHGNQFNVIRRFIPACAGNATHPCQQPAAPTVHPRVCGERSVIGTYRSRPPGSSPRVRGTQMHPAFWELFLRFIPACAGNASIPMVSSGCWAVHPRVCGERGMGRIPRLKDGGSSPRVRTTVRGKFLVRPEKCCGVWSSGLNP